MCTAITDLRSGTFFGRTLDIERSYGEMAVIVPRSYAFEFEKGKKDKARALIGIACVTDGVPLYYDALNESGLWAAALNFPKSCVYNSEKEGKVNVPSYELISRVLRSCEGLDLARRFLENVNITDESFKAGLPVSPLHWIFADRSGCICVEQTKNGLEIYGDPFGVLTNEPPFPYHFAHVTNYTGLSSSPQKNTLFPEFPLEAYSRGLGAFGLPGDFSSSSRFVRALFVKSHTEKYPSDSEEGRVNRFFKITDSVSIPYGCVKTDRGENVCTLYTSLADADSMTYYYTTYNDRTIKKFALEEYELESESLYTVPLF